MLLHVSVNAKTLEQLAQDFKQKKYYSVCQDGLNEYRAGHQDERLLALTGTACSYVDNINPLGSLQAKMISTAEARETSSYFTSLILQKRLIYHFMLDDISLAHLQLPKSPHILSFVFEHLGNGKFKYISKSPKVIKIEDANRSILLSVSQDELKKVVVDEYNGATLIKRHMYQ
jgi:hypothetical protein